MKTKVIDYKKIVDVNTFQPKVRVTLEWLLEDLQDAKIGRTGEEQCSIIGKSISDAIEAFEPFPKVYGKGEWVAETLEDAKQMAKIFAGDVS